MTPLRLPLLIAGWSAALVAGPTSPPAPADPTKDVTNESSQWVFSLLPKSLQKNPQLELTVITEMTDAGRQRAPVSPQHPAYFQLFTTGPRHLGHSHGSEKSLSAPEIEPLLVRALSAHGYLPAEPPTTSPTLLIIYAWGSHFMLTEGDEQNPVLSGDQVARNLLDRAAMVGGEKFARKLRDLFSQAEALSLATPTRTPPGGQPVMTDPMIAFTHPVNLFKRANPRNETLFDQAASDVYYVVASAYDFRSVTENRRQLLWRTRLTVAAAGVSPTQSLPTLIRTAAPYFGRDMTEAALLSRRVWREGNVEVGAPTVVEGAGLSERPGKK